MSTPTADTPGPRVIPAALRYGLALSSVAVALLLTSLARSDYLFAPPFFLAVILTAWVGGIGPGLLSALLSTLVISYFYLPPKYSLIFDLVHIPQLILFFVSAALVSWWSVTRRRAETLLRQARDEQETKVQERTADLKQANEKLQAEIAERRRVGETLRERADLLDLTHDTVFARGMDDVITYWNRGAEERYGWTSEEAVGQTSHDLLRTLFPAPLDELNAELIRTGRWEGELIHTRRDGAQVVAASRWALQRDESGRPVAVLETNNDITERKRAEDALRESEEQWKAVFENNPTMYFMVDADGTILSVNPFGAEQLGYAVGELVGSPVLNVFYEADREAARGNVAVCIGRLDRPMSWEARKVRKDGTVFWVRETARAVLLKSRPIVLVACEDITELKRAEEALRERASLLDLTHDTVYVRGMDDVITYWNRGAQELYGWTSEEAVGQVSHRLTQTVFPAPLDEINRQLLDTGRWEGELIHVKRDGARVVVASRWALQRDERGNPVAVLETNNDITERRRAEEALRESESRYRYIFQAAGVSIWEEDFSQVKAAVDELKAGGVRDLRPYIAGHPDFVRRAVTMVKVIDVNDASVKLFKAESKEELLVALEKVFLPETEEVFARELVALAEGQTSFETETVLQTLKGDRLTVLFTITFPPAPTRLDNVLVTLTDITERKRAEEALQKAQAELAHVTRVTTMGELTSSIAHEVNQPLTAIVTNANAALRWLAAQPPNLAEARETVGRIARDGHRASEVVGRVRALFRKAITDKSRLDVNDLIQESVALVHGEARRNRAVLRTELADDIPPVMGDRVQLQQVVLNLIINGVEAMGAVTGRPRELLVRTERDGSDGVSVSVRDSGVGFDPLQADRLFDAFHTTKPEGMGMGLSVSRSIIEAHGGRLQAEPNEGHGATFRFTLPADGGGRHD